MGIPGANSSLRELIPRSNSGKVDESAALSAADVITLLDNIRARSEGIKEKVQRTVTNYHDEFLRIITQSNETVVHVENVAEQLKKVLDLLGEKKLAPISEGKSGEIGSGLDEDSTQRPVDLEICHVAAEVHGLKSKVRENEKALVVVETILSLHCLLLETERKFVPGQLVEAAGRMMFLQGKLGLKDVNEESGVKGEDVRVFKLLQEEWSDRYNQVHY
jgi:hypothetical protein